MPDTKTPSTTTGQQADLPKPKEQAGRFRFAKTMIERAFGAKEKIAPESDLAEKKSKKTGLAIAKSEEKKISAYLNSVSIALDGYDDIFSDFDPSSYSVRALSDDFVKELMKRYGEHSGGELRIAFSLPKKERNKNSESVIRERLKKYFEWKLKELDEDIKEETLRGAVYIGVGAMLLTGCVLINTYLQDILVFKIVSELLQVPAWFGEFVGVEKIVESRAKVGKQKRFYEKFRDASCVFTSNEDIVEKMVAATSEVKGAEAKAAESKPAVPSKTADAPKTAEPAKTPEPAKTTEPAKPKEPND